MKKKLLVAALVASFAGFTGVAQADSVVLYGTLDGGLGFNTYTIKQNQNNVQNTIAAGRGFAFETGLNKGSKLGFKGEALIWGSTSGIFKLESSLNVLNGDGGKFSGGVSKLFDGAAFFGFTSPAWGRLTVGYQGSASKEFAILPFSNFGIGKALPSGKLGDVTPSSLFKGTAFGNAAGAKTGSLKYVTPVFAGLQLGLSYDYNFLLRGEEQKGANVAHYSLLTYQVGKEGAPKSFQHASVGLSFSMGPVALAATYDAYLVPGQSYRFDYTGTPVAKDKNAKNAEQSYSVGASVNIRGIVLTASWAQAFSDIAFKFGAQSKVGGNIASNLYSTFFQDQMTDSKNHDVVTGITQKYRNKAFGVGITIPATEQGKFYFAYTGSIATANRVHGDVMKDPKGNIKVDGSTLSTTEPSTTVKAFSQLWRAGYVQHISKFTSLYVYAGFGDVKFYEKPVAQSGWKDSNDVGTARLQQYGIGITHDF